MLELVPRLSIVSIRFARLRRLGHLGFPFTLGREESIPMRKIGSIARHALPGSSSRWGRPINRAVMLVLWPAGAASDILRMMRSTPPSEQAASGWGRICRGFDAYRLAITHNIPPLEYHLYELHRAEQRARMGEYLYWTEVQIHDWLNRKQGADSALVQDKNRFAAQCARFELPHVPTLAVFEKGKQALPEIPFMPNVPALWIKDLHGTGGSGAQRFFRENESYRDSKGNQWTPQQLVEMLQSRTCIVQPCIFNHPVIANISNDKLASLRVITGIHRNGIAEVIGCVFYLPHGNRLTSVAGITCAIDSETGRIERAIFLGHGNADLDRHPDTGKPIAGTVLPFWSQSLELARRAHETAFAPFVTLGWDIALTPEGPVLLETNKGWGPMHYQIVYRRPLGQTRFPAIVSQYL